MTAEVAVALPSLIVLLALLLGAATAGLTQLRLEEAARAGAREVVRGERADEVQATVRRLAGSQSQLEVAEQGVWTTVTVGSRVSLPGVDFLGWDLSASATARAELQKQVHGKPYRGAPAAENKSAACHPGTGGPRGGCAAPPGQAPTEYSS
ncbi:TadE family type IV pilus minor pilin [Arthrobacter sp. 260]|uniref:TadE family type IV pilus minor pilin n=1 Tax=Arthrobacter sp. 260 TaxID=2735314 RepID=UPI001C0F647B